MAQNLVNLGKKVPLLLSRQFVESRSIIAIMHKLIILIDGIAETTAFGESWPEFLHLAESMPGLVREATVRVDTVLYGSQQISMIHELFFNNQGDLRQALISKQGQDAGKILQKITDGRMTLLIAEHKEDDIDNLRKYHQGNGDADTQ
ncbi:MAG: EthD family reductase [Chloroflexi bacterium]|nr:EthD family reductase [Chloroflexota bacterium]